MPHERSLCHTFFTRSLPWKWTLLVSPTGISWGTSGARLSAPACAVIVAAAQSSNAAVDLRETIAGPKHRPAHSNREFFIMLIFFLTFFELNAAAKRGSGRM